jgi:hypothetical protein
MSDLAATTTDRTTNDLSIEGREKSPVRSTGWVRNLTVAAVVVALIALSFVFGRVSNNHSGATHAQTGQTATAGLSLQAERQAQARLAQGNHTVVSDSGQTATAGPSVQSERQAQARLAQGNPTEVSDAGHNALSLCPVRVPC